MTGGAVTSAAKSTVLTSSMIAIGAAAAKRLKFSSGDHCLVTNHTRDKFKACVIAVMDVKGVSTFKLTLNPLQSWLICGVIRLCVQRRKPKAKHRTVWLLKVCCLESE